MTAPEALKQVLSRTGLSFKYLDDNTVTIISIATSAAPLPFISECRRHGPHAGLPTLNKRRGRKSSSSGFLLAQVAQGAPAGSPPLEKRNERASDK